MLTAARDADRVVDSKCHIAVPHLDNPQYTLRRVWFTHEEEERFYYGFSNEALWPLCHIVYVKPKFNEADWQVYKSVNQKFADVVLGRQLEMIKHLFLSVITILPCFPGC